MPTDNYTTKWLPIANSLLSKMASITDVKSVIQGDLALDSTLSDNKDCVAFFTIADIPLGTPGNKPTLGKWSRFAEIPVRVGIAVESTKADGGLLDKMKVRLFDWLADEWTVQDFGGYQWSEYTESMTIQRLGQYHAVSYVILIGG